MKNLQEIVDNKAKIRSEYEVQELINIVRKNKTLFEVMGNFKISIDGTSITLRDCFWGINDKIPKKLIEELIKIYIPEESKLFIEKVENLSNEIEDLKNY